MPAWHTVSPSTCAQTRSADPEKSLHQHRHSGEQNIGQFAHDYKNYKESKGKDKDKDKDIKDFAMAIVTES